MSIYILIIAILLILAIIGLVVGVANDAVNFVTSAVGSKAAPYRVVLAVASAGILIGALSSNAMMEVARSGVFYPSEFTFSEVIMLFLGVLFANIILLDLFNTFGLPTSVTICLVFALLGATIAVAAVKIIDSPTLMAGDLSKFVNSGKALVIISAILASVAIAFVLGLIIMFITRVIFTFRYKKVFSRFGYMWCGVAFTAIIYFAVFKGFESSGLISKELLVYAKNHLWRTVAIIWLGSSILMLILQHIFRINILKVTILAGTFSLALAFAGNDMVNFIGVPMAGWDAFRYAGGMEGAVNPDAMMGQLAEPVTAHFGFLVAAGALMVLTLWTSKKAKSVTETEINLAKQDEGAERFGSTMLSRSIVRFSISLNRGYERLLPESAKRFFDRRFLPLSRYDDNRDKAPFDMIRATVNLTVASILIASATSLKLPLSTTYVTFMVAMGTSLADRAWGRESAVYRVTGVLTVISGWFVTAFVAFIIAFGVTMALMYGGIYGILGMSVLCGYLLFQSGILHKRREKKVKLAEHKIYNNEMADVVINRCIEEVSQAMESVTNIYQETLTGLFDEDRTVLRRMLKESNELFYQARERKYEVMPTLQKLQNNYIDTGHYYVQVVDYISEATKALVHITRPSFDHIDNNHEGLSQEQVDDLIYINDEVSNVYDKINMMLESNDFKDIDVVLRMRDKLFEDIDEAIKNQLRRIKSRSSSTKSSMLYLSILTETKTMVLQSRNMLKSQRHFVGGGREDK